MAGYRKDSLYRATSLKDGQYLDVLQMPTDDLIKYQTYTLTIEHKYDSRPDILAYDLFGNPKLWWVFAFFNQDILQDPIVDFTAGLEITVPVKFL